MSGRSSKKNAVKRVISSIQSVARRVFDLIFLVLFCIKAKRTEGL